MKKFYTGVAALALVLGANAQSSNKATSYAPTNLHNVNSTVHPVIHPQNPSTQAQGDTVFVFDGFYVYDWNSTLPATFNFQLEDLDGATINSAISAYFGTTGDYKFFYSIDPTSNLHYAHADSVFFAGATSWFQTAGQADNWLEMGPITVPATGGTLWWRHNLPDPSFRDGYEVLVNTISLNSSDFTNAPVFSVGDNASSTQGDTANTPYTVFYQRSADVSAYAGQDIYIAFHHNANDQFILYLTDVILTEGPMSVAEEANGIALAENYPNPANGSTRINYTLQNNSDVTFNVYDLTGQLVSTENLGNQVAGQHTYELNTSNMSNGMYFFSFTVNGQTVSRKFTVENK